MNIIYFLLLVLNFGIFAVISITVLYFLFFSVASMFFRQKKVHLKSNEKRPVTIIFPAYQEDNVILNSAGAA